MIPFERSRTLLVLGAVLALGSHSKAAEAQPPGPDVLARLDRRVSHSPRVRVLTLAGFVEATGVRATPEGLTYRDIIASTRNDTLPAPGTLAWDAVLGVDASGNKAAEGALKTGTGLGVIGLLIGFAGGVASPMGEVGLWAFEGAAIGFAGGALLGGAIGATQGQWVRVYPSTLPAGATPARLATATTPAPARDDVVGMADTAHVRLIAIAPLANFTRRRAAEQETQAIREGLNRELMRRSGSHTVAVQALAETDRILREASTSADASSRLPPDELCRLLGVDAVIVGAITRYRQKGGIGTAAAIVFLAFSVKGREVEADLAIYEGAGGGLVWRQNVRAASGLMTSAGALGDVVGGAVWRKFPYRRSATRR